MMHLRPAGLCAFTSLALALSSGAAAMGQLANPGFEAAGNPPSVFDGWIDFGNSIPNIYREAAFPLSGGFACKMFGQFTGGVNASGVYQSFPTVKGQTWDGSAWAAHITGDALVGVNFGAVNIEFRGPGNELLEFFTVSAIDALSPLDTYLQSTVQGIAPEDVASVRFVLLFVQPDFDAGALFFDDASLTPVGAPLTTLLNPGFEDATPEFSVRALRGWGEFGRNDFGNIRIDNLLPLTGQTSVAMFGQFTGSENFTGVYQSVPCAPGDQVTAEVWSAMPGIDPLVAGNEGFLNIEFRDASNNLIPPILTTPAIAEGGPTDTYIRSEVLGVAPAGAVKARLAIGLRQPALGGGNIFFDDAAITVVSAPPQCAGDANGDNQVNGADLSVLLSQFGQSVTPGVGADFNNDGLVNGADLSVLLSNFGDDCSL